MIDAFMIATINLLNDPVASFVITVSTMAGAVWVVYMLLSSNIT